MGCFSRNIIQPAYDHNLLIQYKPWMSLAAAGVAGKHSRKAVTNNHTVNLTSFQKVMKLVQQSTTRTRSYSRIILIVITRNYIPLEEASETPTSTLVLSPSPVQRKSTNFHPGSVALASADSVPSGSALGESGRQIRGAGKDHQISLLKPRSLTYVGHFCMLQVDHLQPRPT